MNRLRRFKGIAVLLGLAGVLAALPAFAQTTAGVLRGYVRDSNGASMAGVTVKAVDDDSGIAWTAVTGADGYYNLAVSPDPYTVTATLNDLVETRKVIVILGQAQALDFTLAVKAEQQVVVSATAPVIDTRVQRDRDQRQHAAAARPAAGQSQLPEFRGPRSGHAPLDGPGASGSVLGGQ